MMLSDTTVSNTAGNDTAVNGKQETLQQLITHQEMIKQPMHFSETFSVPCVTFVTDHR